MFWLSYMSKLRDGGKMKVMILGAGGGIGRALLEAYAEAPQTTQIYATHHLAVCDVSPLVRWLQLDLGNPASVEALTDQVEDPIDRWICCTGVLTYSDNGPEKSLRQLRAEKLQRDHMINAIGPLTAFSAMASKLRTPGLRAAFLSAQVGSIEDNRLGGWWSYRMSKAALNMATVASLVMSGAAEREASAGLHHNVDKPPTARQLATAASREPAAVGAADK